MIAPVSDATSEPEQHEDRQLLRRARRHAALALLSRQTSWEKASPRSNWLVWCCVAWMAVVVARYVLAMAGVWN